MTGTYDPTEELGRLRREADMFADLDGWLDKREAEGDPVAPRIRQTLNFTSDPQDTKTRFSIQNWVVSQTGMDPLDVADTWGQLRGQVAQELGLAPNSNDAQIHGALTAKAQKDVKKAEIRRNMHLLENPDPGEWDGLVNALKRGGLSLGQMGETFRAEMSLQVGDLLESKRKKLESDLNIRKQIDPGMEGLSELEEKLSRLGKAQTATKSLVGDDALRIASAEEAKEGYPATKVVSEFLASDTVDWGKFVENPVEIVAQVIAESLPVSVPSLAGGVAAGPAGAGAGSFITENSLGILDSMRAQGVDLRDEKQVEAFFSDPEKMLEAGRYAVRHGVPVAAFDALSFGIAGKLIGSQKGAMRKLAAGVAEMGIQSSLGAGGEALGQISATGGVENWNEVFLEAVAEIGTGTAEIGIGLLRQQAEARAASPKSADYLDGIGGEEVDTSAVTKNAAGGFTVTRPDGVSVDVGTIEEAVELAPVKERGSDYTPPGAAHVSEFGSHVRKLQERIQKASGLSEEAKERIGNRYYNQIREKETIGEAIELLQGLTSDEQIQLLTDETVGMEPRIQMAGLLNWLKTANTELENATGESRRQLLMRISDVGEFVVERGTELGQGVEIMKAFSYLTPEAVVVTVTKRIKRNRAEKLDEVDQDIKDAGEGIKQGQKDAVKEAKDQTKKKLPKGENPAKQTEKEEKVEESEAERVINQIAKAFSDTPSMGGKKKETLLALWKKYVNNPDVDFATEATRLGATEAEIESLEKLSVEARRRVEAVKFERKKQREASKPAPAEPDTRSDFEKSADQIIDRVAAQFSDTPKFPAGKKKQTIEALWRYHSTKGLPNFKEVARRLGLSDQQIAQLDRLARENRDRVEKVNEAKKDKSPQDDEVYQLIPVESIELFEGVELGFFDPRSALAEKLAKRIKASETRNETSDDPVKVMIDTLFSVAKDDLGTNQVTTVEGEKLTLKQKIEFALRMRAQFREVWESAQEIVGDRYKNDAEALSALDRYFAHFLETPFSEKYLKGAVKEELKADAEVTGADLDKMVLDDPRKLDKYGRDLADRFADGMNISFDDAKKLAADFLKEFDRIVSKKKEEAIRRRLGKREVRKNKAFWQKVIEASNLGGFDTAALRDAFSERLNLPSMTPEFTDAIHKQGQKIQDAKGENAKLEAVRELNYLIERHKGIKTADKMVAVYLSNILAGISTQVLNIGNTFLELNGAILTRARWRNPRELSLAYASLFKGFAGKGFDDFNHILRTGHPPAKFRSKLDVPATLELDPFSGLLKPLNNLKYVGRFLLASDAFMRGGLLDSILAVDISRRMQEDGVSYTEASKAAIDAVFGTEAMRSKFEEQAEQEGLSGRDKDRRVVELIEGKLEDAVVERAVDEASRGTFTNKAEGHVGLIANRVNQAVQEVPALRTIVPFVNTVADVSNSLANYSPYGFVRAIRGTTKSVETKSGVRQLDLRERSQLAKKAALGSFVAYILAMMDDPEDDDGFIEITAAGPGNYNDANQLRTFRNWKPYTIKIGGTRFNYLYTPLAIPMAFVGFWKDHQRYGSGDDADALNRIGLATFQAGTTFASQSFLSSSADFFEIVFDPHNPDSKMEKLGNFFGRAATGLAIPNLLRQIQEIFDHKIYDSNSIHAGLIKQTPVINHIFLDQKLNIFGEGIERDGIPILNRFVSPDSTEGDEVYEFMAKRRAFLPGFRTTEILGDNKMTDEQRYEFVKKAGGLTKETIKENLPRLERIRSQEELDKELSKISSAARSAVKKEMRNAQLP